jgi:hypothetical protein
MWALGFEAMLTVHQTDVPLTPAMKTKLITATGADASVIESEVLVEIENGKSERIVVQRGIKGSRDNHLVTVAYGPALTQPGGSHKTEDFYVSRPGGAVNERGFHQFLAKFLGWQLPEVQTFEGRLCPLYLQCLFPYSFVEQTRGWSSLQPPVPTQFRIREVHKRAVEFLLKMDAHEIAAKRQTLRDTADRIEGDWSTLLRESKINANSVDGVLQGIPSSPLANWPPQVPPRLLLSRGDKWVPIDQIMQSDKGRLLVLVETEIPRVNEITAQASSELSQLEQTLREREAVLARVLNAAEQEQSEANAVQTRLAVLDEDLRRNKDVQILHSIGSNALPAAAGSECPTCHQQLHGTLLPVPDSQPVMSIEENISFMTEQRKTFNAVLANASQVVNARQQQASALRGEITEIRSQIRTLRQTLVSDGRLPSAAAIRSRLELERSIDQITKAEELFAQQISEFEKAAGRWKKVQADLKALPEENVSDTDRKKIDRLIQLFREQLKQYGFQSLKTDEVAISEDTYKPEHLGFDLPSNISASDFIRVIWAYLNGLLELARFFPTSHPGLLIFDEPKQQSTKDLSFAELLRRVSSAGTHNQQVIFATSETQATLKNSLTGVAHTYVSIEGRIIRKL